MMNTNAKRADLPPLDLLRSFESAARHLSFTITARELHLTQSAVSRQIQQLEASLGVPLFERRHRALVLTDGGQVLQRAVVESLERLRDATARLRSAPTPRQVAVTTTAGFASLWLIPRLARFTANHPQVDVRVSATNELLDLDRGRLDVAVRFLPIDRGVGPVLFEESVLPLCAPAVAVRLGGLADLSAQTLLVFEPPNTATAPPADWPTWLDAMGLPDLRMKNTLRFSQYADAVAAAVAGQGVLIGRLPLLRELLTSGVLVAPFVDAASSRLGYFIETSRAAVGNPNAQDFVRWLRAEADAAAIAAFVEVDERES